MIAIKETSYYPIIKECFAADKDLLTTYHIEATKGLDACVNRTCKDLTTSNIDVYKIMFSNEIVGFFGIENLVDMKALTGFFLKPEFRDKKKEFWNCIESEIKDPTFLCGIYKKNVRASKFLEKRNGIVVFTNKEGLVFKLENSLCLSELQH